MPTSIPIQSNFGGQEPSAPDKSPKFISLVKKTTTRTHTNTHESHDNKERISYRQSPIFCMSSTIKIVSFSFQSESEKCWWLSQNDYHNSLFLTMFTDSPSSDA